MKLNDLLYNHERDAVERDTVIRDGCNRISSGIPNDILLCIDVRSCIDFDFISSEIIKNNSFDNDFSINNNYINTIIDVVWNAPTLIVGDTSINITNFLNTLEIGFKDIKFNGFNSAGTSNIIIEGLDGLIFVNDGLDTLQIGLPTPPAEYFSDSGNDGPSPQLPGDYLPFNHNLVLTWNEDQHRAEWIQKQCCDLSLDFHNMLITVDLGDTFIDTYGINTDNQELTLAGNLLSISRWHGGSNGIQINDADSVVDLTDINEHTLGLSGNRTLKLIGSDGLLNSTLDLIRVGPKTLGFNDTTNIVSIYNDDMVEQSSVNISGLNNQLLSIVNGWLHLTGNNGCCGKNVVYYRKPVQYCSDIAGCLCGRSYSRAERESTGVVGPSGWVTPQWLLDRHSQNPTARPLATARPAGREEFLNSGPSICDMLSFLRGQLGMPSASYGMNGTNGRDGNNGADGGVGPAGSNGVPGPTGPAGSDGMPGPTGPAGSDGLNGQSTTITNIVTKQKYWGKIFNTETRTMWSRNTGDGLSSGPYARRYYPEMDGGDGRSNISTEMINSDNFITPSLNRCVINGQSYNISAIANYTTSKSTNNPNNSDEGNACRATSKTITIPYDGMYLITANLEFEVDHNVHAFRAAVIRKRINKISPLVDTKLGGGTDVGSNSLNNPTYPITKQYTLSGSKIVELKKGDVIFLGVRIDPGTSWPKDHPDVWLNERSSGGPGSGIDDPFGYFYFRNDTAGSPKYGRNSSPVLTNLNLNFPYFGQAGYSTLNNMYNNQANTSNDFYRLPWAAPMAPDMTSRFFWTPAGGSSGAENYGYSLSYPTMTNGYWKDDGVVKLLGPSTCIGNSGDALPGSLDDGGGMITVTFQNKKYS